MKTTPARWTPALPDLAKTESRPAPTILRLDLLRRRHGLNGSLAGVVAGLAFGEGRP